MDSEKNIIIVIILVVLFFVVGYMYYRVNNNSVVPVAVQYAPNSLLSNAYSAYYPPAPAYNTSNSRAYSYSAPRTSTSTSSSYYSTPGSYSSTYYDPTYYPPTQNQNCYVSGYDQYGTPIMACQ